MLFSNQHASNLLLLTLLLLLNLKLQALDTSQLACGDKFFQFHGNCYHISPYFDVWSNAKAYCDSLGAEIVSQLPPSKEVTSHLAKVKSKIYWVRHDKPSLRDGSLKCSIEDVQTLGVTMLADCNSRLPSVCMRPLWSFAGTCPKGFFGAGDACFRLFGDVTDRVAPAEAAKRCAAFTLDGKLAKIDHETQLAAVVSRMEGRAEVDVCLTFGPNLLQRMQRREFFVSFSGDSFRIFGTTSVLPGVAANANGSACGFVCMAKRTGKRVQATTGQRAFSGAWERGRCAHGFVSYGKQSNLCVRLPSSEQKTWSEARSFCRGLGADLVSISSEFEQANVQLVRTVVDRNLWIGIKDGNWSDGLRTKFSKFQSKSGDQCGSIDLFGEWLSQNCSAQLPFLCAKRLRPKRPVIDVTRKCVFTDPSLIQFGRFCYQLNGERRLDMQLAAEHCCTRFKLEHLTIGDRQALDQYTDRNCVGNVLEIDSREELEFILQAIWSNLSDNSFRDFKFSGLWISKTHSKTPNYLGWPSLNKVYTYPSTTCTVSSIYGEWEEKNCNIPKHFVCKTPTIPSGIQEEQPPEENKNDGLQGHVVTLSVCVTILFIFVVICITALLYKKVIKVTRQASSGEGESSEAAKTMSQLLERPPCESPIMDDIYEEMEAAEE